MVARTLAEAGYRILLIEAGPDVPTDRTPANYLHLFGSSDDWGFGTVPQVNLANRQLRYPRGRGPGGSTRINAMIWYPPGAEDLRNLSAAGGAAWSHVSLTRTLDDVSSWVQPESPRYLTDATTRFLAAAISAGVAMSPFARMTRDGFRRTAADILDESSAVRSITKWTAEVKKIRFDRSHAIGVDVVPAGCSAVENIEANRAVILCAGAIHSPSLLIRSGIGPKESLLDLGIELIQEHGEVGRNLSDHLVMPVIYSMDPKYQFSSKPTGDELLSNIAEAGGTKQRGQASLLQVHMTPTHYLTYPSDSAPAALTIGINLCQPHSRGSVRVTKSDRAHEWGLQIDPGFLMDTRDADAMLEGIQWARMIAGQASLLSVIRDELIPGAKRQSTDAIMRSIERFAQTLYHPVGTCRMGLGKDAVVDEYLAVRGVSGLHVIDGSVLPTIPSVNPNATIMMLAMHGAASLCERYG